MTEDQSTDSTTDTTLDEVKLGRVGHYSYQEVCQEATIVHVFPPTYDSNTGEATVKVNVHGHIQDGDCFARMHVNYGHKDGPDAEFHLNRDCPWGK